MKRISFSLLALSILVAGSLFFSPAVNAQTTQNILGTATLVNTFNFGSQVLLTQSGTNGVCFISFSGTAENKMLAVALTAQSANKQLYAQVDSGFTCANYAWGNAYGFMLVN